MKSRAMIAVVAVAGIVGAWWFFAGGDRGRGKGGPGDRSDQGDAPALSQHLQVAGERVAIPAWFGQTGAPSRRIAGRVVYEGAPVAGAQVRLVSALFTSGFAPEPVIETDDDGRFDFGALPAAQYQVTATAPDRMPYGRPVDLRDPVEQPPPDQLELRLRDCTARLVASVVDASGGPIDGVSVRVSSWRWLITGVTDERGELELCVVPGSSRTTVHADGYGKLERRLYVVGRTPANFELTPAATLTGRVELDGRAIPRARVTVRSHRYSGPATSVEHTLTDSDGTFSIDTLTAGRYRVSASADNAESESTQVVVRAGEITPEVVIQLEPTVAISGVVMEEDTPVAGVSLVASMQSGSGSGSAVSQEDGTFVITGMRAGVVELASGTHKLLEPEQVQVDATVGADIVVDIAAQATIRGRVVHKGKPVVDATVSTRGGATLSDRRGEFTLRGLDAGKYELYAESQRVGAFTRRVEVEVGEGETKTGVELELDLEASIAGKVVDETGAPLAGAYLAFSLRGGRDFGRATTEEDGSFLATAMSGGGEYEVVIQRSAATSLQLSPASGESFPTVKLDDGASAVTGVEFVVSSETFSISGRAERASGAPVADALVQVYRQRRRSGAGEVPQAITDVEGSFQLTGLPKGDYYLWVELGEGTRSPWTKVAAGTEDVVVVLPDTGTVDGELIGFTEPVEVTLRGERHRQTYRVRVASDRFRLDDVAAGEYQVVVAGASEGEISKITVEADQIVAVKLQNPGTGEIRGRVVDFDSGEAKSGYRCSWTKLGESKSAYAFSDGWAKSDGDGRFAMKAPAGKVELRCFNPSSTRDERVSEPTAKIEAGQTTSVSIFVVRSEVREYDIDAGFFMIDADPKVQYVFSGSAAARAGLKVDDRIVAINGTDVTMLPGEAAFHLLGRYIDQTVELTVRRGSEQLTLELPIKRRQRN